MDEYASPPIVEDIDNMDPDIFRGEGGNCGGKFDISEVFGFIV
jgi:hypothetical protein